MIDQNIVHGSTSDAKHLALGLLLVSIGPVAFAVTTVMGAIRWFSPVPYWDMWEGYLQFYLDTMSGQYGAFFAQANEHRIILSKLLFWLDLRFFGGLSHLLIPINLLLMAALWVALTISARFLMASNRRLAYHVSMLAAPLCFSWLQTENLNWGYQSQFFVAYLIPLLALMSFARWAYEPSRDGWFIVSLTLGVVSTITMANGLLTLPLLIAMLVLSGRFSWPRMLVLIGVTAITFTLWMRHYDLIHRPSAGLVAEIEFALLFLGGPIAAIFQSFELGVLIGVAVAIAFLFLALQWVRRATDNHMFLALVLFVAYIIAAAVAAAHSRAFIGLVAASSPRYATPSLLAYAAILLLFVHLHRERAGTIATVSTLAVVVPLLLLATQLNALKSEEGPERAWKRMQAALALDLGVIDNEATGTVYPADEQFRIDLIHKIASAASAHDLSVFGLPEMEMARRAIGRSPEALGLHQCLGQIDVADSIKTDPTFERMTGWVLDNRNQRVPRVAFPVAQGTVIGAVLTGLRRPDVRQSVNVQAATSGFQGYARTPRRQDTKIYCAD